MRLTHWQTMLGAVGVLALLAAPTRASAQQGGVAGRVTDKATTQSLVGAQVSVVGTTVRSLTDREGKYRITNLAPGSYSIRVLFIGYTSGVQSVTVSAGETATLDIALTPAPIGLDALVVTATGNEQNRAQASSIQTIDAAKVAQQAPVTRTGWPKHGHARVGLPTTSTRNDDVALGALYAADGRMCHAVPPGPRGEQHRSRVERPTAWVDARGDGLRLALEGALSEHGFEPWHDDHGTVRMRNCPFRRLADMQPEVVCHMNLALIEGLVAGLGADNLNPVLNPEPEHCCVAIPAATHDMNGTT